MLCRQLLLLCHVDVNPRRFPRCGACYVDSCHCYVMLMSIHVTDDIPVTSVLDVVPSPQLVVDA